MNNNMRLSASDNDNINAKIIDILNTLSTVWMTLIAPIIVGMFISHWFSLDDEQSVSAALVIFALIFIIVHLSLAYMAMTSKKKHHTHAEVSELYTKYNEQVGLYNKLRNLHEITSGVNISQRTVLYLVSSELDKAIGELNNHIAKSPIPLKDSENALLEKHLENLLWPIIVDKGNLFGYREAGLYNLALYVYNSESDKLEVKMRFNDERIKTQNRSWSPGMGHVGMAFLHKEIKCCPDIEQSTELRSQNEHDLRTYRSFISVPIIACEDNENTETKPHGVLVLTSADERQFDLVRDQIFLLSVSKLLSIYLDKHEYTKKIVTLLDTSEGGSEA